MSDPKPIVRISPWLGGSVLTLLVLQLGLLWLQGSMVQRQRQDILGLREDVQAMAESLDDDQQGADSTFGDNRPTPARMRMRLRGRGRLRTRVAQIAYYQAKADDDEAVRKELEQSRDSAKANVAKGQEVQAQLSVSENLRKADEKARVEAEGRKARPWLWAGAALALLLMVTRSLRRRE